MNIINSVVPATNPSIAVVEQNKQAFISSLVIAEQLGIKHKAVLLAIKKHSEQLENYKGLSYMRLPFATKGGIQKRNVALLTHDQAIFLLTLSRNTPRAVEIKANIAKAFARFIENQQVAMTYKPVYSDLQGTLRALAEYSNPDNANLSLSALSMRYNGLINKACGVESGKREVLTYEQRAKIAQTTDRVCAEIIAAMQAGVKPKRIYKAVAESVVGFSGLEVA